jgi:hypothetical protein
MVPERPEHALVRQNLTAGVQTGHDDVEQLRREPQTSVEIAPHTPGGEAVKVYSFGSAPPEEAIRCTC